MADFWDFLSDPRVLNFVGTGLQVAGGLQQREGAQEMGRQSMELAQFQADQLRAQALGAAASGQRQAFFEDRQARIVASNALAAAAASGGGASDPTVINIIAGIAQEGAYRQQAALYEGEDRARQLRLQAAATERSGGNAQRTSSILADNQMLAATSTLLRGAAKDTMLARFGGDGPPGSRLGDRSDY